MTLRITNLYYNIECTWRLERSVILYGLYFGMQDNTKADEMVDPASGSQQQQQPPTLSITVVPLNVLDDPFGGAQELDGDEDEAGGGLLLHPLSEAAVLEASQSLYDDIVDDVILGIVFEVHRGAKLGLTALLEDGLTGIRFYFLLTIKRKLYIQLRRHILMSTPWR